MNNELSQAILAKVMGWSETEDLEYRTLLQTMASYKYDDYHQFSPGMRFIESLSQWLNKFKTKEERHIAIDFIKGKLIFISNQEMNRLVYNVYPDFIKKILIEKIAVQENISKYHISKIVNCVQFKTLKRQCLFLGFSDGAKIELFRRANFRELSHEQIYQTYELSDQRAYKMQDELVKDLQKILGREPTHEESKFKIIFLMDDFTASGRSYIREKGSEVEGKIKSIYDELKSRSSIINKDNFDLKIIFYLCTHQAQNYINCLLNKLPNPVPKIYPFYLLNDSINIKDNDDIFSICCNEDYYDKELLEDRHTREGGDNVKLGFGNCRLPLVLNHNTPNNSISILWSYAESDKFVGLFPRVPRHKE